MRATTTSTYCTPALRTEIKTWVSNYIYRVLWNVIAHTCTNQIAVKLRAWASSYIPLIYLDVITYPCFGPISGLS